MGPSPPVDKFCRHFGNLVTKVLVRTRFGDNIAKIQVGTNGKTMKNNDFFVILSSVLKLIREGFPEKVFLQGFEIIRDLNWWKADRLNNSEDRLKHRKAKEARGLWQGIFFSREENLLQDNEKS